MFFLIYERECASISWWHLPGRGAWEVLAGLRWKLLTEPQSGSLLLPVQTCSSLCLSLSGAWFACSLCLFTSA